MDTVLPEAAVGLTTLLMHLTAITDELVGSDEARSDPAARSLLEEIRRGVGDARRSAMTLLLSYRNEQDDAQDNDT